MIELINLRKKFGEDHWVTNDVTLTIPAGKITALIGRSGEGKSVLLKQMMGLIKPTSGSIVIDGVNITTLNEKEMATVFNKCGYVFQFAALLDSLTIFENIAFSLLEQGMSSTALMPLVKETLSMVDLNEEILSKYPCEISGGMRKRVGLARTLVTNPTIIFYDEPTSGLDPITSRVVHELMQKMQQERSITSVVISHDIEIFKFVDYVALLHEGQIRYFGDATSIWDSDNPYMYQFIRGLSQGPIQAETDSNKT